MGQFVCEFMVFSRMNVRQFQLIVQLRFQRFLDSDGLFHLLMAMSLTRSQPPRQVLLRIPSPLLQECKAMFGFIFSRGQLSFQLTDAILETHDLLMWS